jgi:hypothetical protein
MRVQIAELVNRLNLKYERVKSDDVVPMFDGDFSTLDVFREIHDIMKRRPQGRYRMACIYTPSGDLLPDDIEDADIDEMMEEAEKIFTELTGEFGCWEIPEGDELWDEELVSLVFS